MPHAERHSQSYGGRVAIRSSAKHQIISLDMIAVSHEVRPSPCCASGPVPTVPKHCQGVMESMHQQQQGQCLLSFACGPHDILVGKLSSPAGLIDDSVPRSFSPQSHSRAHQDVFACTRLVEARLLCMRAMQTQPFRESAGSVSIPFSRISYGLIVTGNFQVHFTWRQSLVLNMHIFLYVATSFQFFLS